MRTLIRFNKKIILFGLFYCLIFTNAQNENNSDFEKIAKIVNSASNSTWKADPNIIKSAPHIVTFTPGFSTKPSNLYGSNDFKSENSFIANSIQLKGLPKEFDLREKYPGCILIGAIKIQSNCGACWALASSAAFSDRICVATNGSINVPLSSDHLLTCCANCYMTSGCEGGDPLIAWAYMKKHGICSGGEYASHVGCKPYRIAPCGGLGYKKCEKRLKIDFDCRGKTCTNPYFRTSYSDNVYYTKIAYQIEAPETGDMTTSDWYDLQEQIMRYEIYRYGSIVAGMVIYEDFQVYQSGIYHHIIGNEVGSHAVKLIGWGEEDGVKYWLGVNSWTKQWGQNGLFKIKRGVGECKLEVLQVSAGLFDFERSSNLTEFMYDFLSGSSTLPKLNFLTVLILSVAIPGILRACRTQ